MPEAVIVSAVRTPVGRAYKGSLRATRPDDLAALAIKEALARVPGLNAKEIDDVILGCAMPEGEQGMNVARIAALRAGLPVETSAMACSPDEQKRFTVIAEVSTGRPARKAAMRATFIPCSPSGIAQPRITSSISLASKPGTRAIASLMASAARSSGRVARSEPL